VYYAADLLNSRIDVLEEPPLVTYSDILKDLPIVRELESFPRIQISEDKLDAVGSADVNAILKLLGCDAEEQMLQSVDTGITADSSSRSTRYKKKYPVNRMTK
jgi:hypothetical protein